MAEPAAKKRVGEDAGAKPAVVAVAENPEQRISRYVAVLRAVWAWDAMAMFHWPVTEAVAPGYGRVIQQPVDLATLRRKLGDRTVPALPPYFQEDRDSVLPPVASIADAVAAFPSDEHLSDDLALMVSNALQFNQRGTVWYKHAKALRKKLPSLLQEHGVATDAGEVGEDGTRDTVYVPTRFVKDNEATFARDERKAQENLSETLTALEAEKEISVEELREKYQSDAARAKIAEADNEWGSDESSDEDDEDEDDEESDFEDSSDDE